MGFGLAILVLSIMINALLKALGPSHLGIGHAALAWISESVQARILPRLDALSAKNFISRIRISARNMLGKGDRE